MTILTTTRRSSALALLLVACAGPTEPYRYECRRYLTATASDGLTVTAYIVQPRAIPCADSLVKVTP